MHFESTGFALFRFNHVVSDAEHLLPTGWTLLPHISEVVAQRQPSALASEMSSGSAPEHDGIAEAA